MKTKPVILQVVPELTTGGAELSAIEMAEAVHNSGGKAIVVARSGDMIPRLKAVGGHYIALDVATKNPVKIIANIWALKKIIKDHNVSLIHARSRAPAWSAYLAGKSANIPYLATYHGAYNEKNRVKKWYNSVMVRGPITIANSLYVKGLICQRYNLDKNQVRVIYRGIDLEKYNPDTVSETEKAELRKKWGVSPAQKIILLAARLSPIKGHRVVIEAAKLLEAQNLLQDAVFVFAGGDQGRDAYVAELKQKIDQAGLEQQFKFVGHVDAMEVAYAVAHVSMNTSIVPETFGRTGAEAQAMECPIIATTLGGPQETCLTQPKTQDSEITGWLIEPDNASSLAQTLKAILSLPDQQLNEMGKHARRHVLNKFPVSQMQSQTLIVYDELLGSELAQNFK